MIGINFLRQILFLVLIFLLGINFLHLLRVRGSLAQTISYGFMLGVGLSTLGLFLLGFVSYRFTFWNILVFLTISNLSLILFSRSFSRGSCSFMNNTKFFFKDRERMDKFDNFLILCILFFLISSLVENIYWPVYMWDAVQMYDYRAREIVKAQAIFFPAMTSYDISYPLLVSLAESIFYSAGSVNPQFIFTLFFTSLVLGIYSFIKDLTGSRKLALVSSLFLSSYPSVYRWFTSVGSSSVMSLFLIFGTFSLLYWLDRKEKKYLMLGGIFFSFARFTRNEPVWMLTTLLLLLIIFFHRSRKVVVELFDIFVFFALPNYFIGLAFGKYVSFYNFPDSYEYTSQFRFVDKFVENLKNVHLNDAFLDSFVFFYRSVVVEILPLLLVFLLFSFIMFCITKVRISFGRVLKLLLVFDIGYFLFLLGGSFFYRIMYGNTSQFNALNGSVERFSIFWQVLVFVSLVLLLNNFLILMFQKGRNAKRIF